MTEMSILVDDELKAQAEQVFNNAGVTMSTAVSFFLRQVVAQRELPFPLPAHDGQDPVYNPAMLRRLHQSIEHAKQGKYVAKTMEELRRMEDE